MNATVAPSEHCQQNSWLRCRLHLMRVCDSMSWPRRTVASTFAGSRRLDARMLVNVVQRRP
jgi:hypothetical protein